MANDELGEVRRSKILFDGPGAIVDFRAGEKEGGAVSVITGGLESWEKTARVSSPANNPNVIFEPRLQIKLRKRHFRLPPVVIGDEKDEDDYRPHIQGVRFPSWLLCPECGLLNEAHKFGREIGDPSRWCLSCSEKKKSRVYAVPTRFVIACSRGHISDFPWRWYLATAKCKDNSCKLFLESDGRSSGLQSLILGCRKCGAKRSMAGIFGKNRGVFASYPCPGERPWIGDREECNENPSAVQRGASNIYFPMIMSALSIPPWNDWLGEDVPLDWNALRNLDKGKRVEMLKMLSHLIPDGISEEEFIDMANDRLDYINKGGIDNLRKAEYMKFFTASKNAVNRENGPDFKAVAQEICPSLHGFFDKVVKVERLKEVKVQTGFTRLLPPLPAASEEPERIGSLSAGDLDWLPAAVVKGEGVFFTLSEEKIEKWLEGSSLITERCKKIREGYLEKVKEGGRSYNERDLQITPTFLLLHAFAHILIRQMSLSSGYNAASIRERIFCGNSDPEMRGVLIYTATSDADGTLGGLARQSDKDLFADLVKDAVRGSQWCSSDPLCIDDISSISENLNMAACHSCLFSPETSCEYFNMFLDRALIVGTPYNPEIGFFSEILSE